MSGRKASILCIDFGDRLLYTIKSNSKIKKKIARLELYMCWPSTWMPVEERWGTDYVEWVDRVMWSEYKHDDGAFHDISSRGPC